MKKKALAIDTEFVVADTFRSLWDTDQAFCRDIWREKYAFQPLPGKGKDMAETHPLETVIRMVRGVHLKDPDKGRALRSLRTIASRRFIPAGRIWSDAGTPKHTTSINCFVMDTIPDDMAGIFRVLRESALTMQQGGGIGMDFSTLRPEGALLIRTHAVASGPMLFMDTWDSMCRTIMSAGSRRGAMMGVMRIDHPDIRKFIHAKETAGRLTNFNLSVLVTDNFMTAVEEDESWDLGFDKPRLDGRHVDVIERKDMSPWYVYERLSARALWEEILQTTYVYAEPGVIFIDRVNKLNNLSYCETIAATNPCGEQPLPPYGDCLLGAINLAEHVWNAFDENSFIDYNTLAETVDVGVRFLDNVNDTTGFPLPEQAAEARAKRRIGLGVMGLGTALQMLGLRYGGDAALETTHKLFSAIANEAYRASARLAAERGAFPLYDDVAYLKAPFVKKLDRSTRVLIKKHGLRNGVLLTVAPTGTTGILAGNVTSGIEPAFAHSYVRTVRGSGGEMNRDERIYDAGYLAFCKARNFDPETRFRSEMPDSMATAQDLDVEAHVNMQATVQNWIDASISKTVNCPENMPFEKFREVYSLAYATGCKGCTTYRPSGVRGAVLRTEEQAAGEAASGQAGAARPPLYAHLLETPAVACAFCGAQALPFMCKDGAIRGICDQHLVQLDSEESPVTPMSPIGPIPGDPGIWKRPRVLDGRTYKFKPGDHAYYVTITNEDGEPRELFVSTKEVIFQELGAVIGRLVSALMRRGGNIGFVAEELQQVHTPAGWHEGGRYWPSRSAAIGAVIQEHLDVLATGGMNAVDTSSDPWAKMGQKDRMDVEFVGEVKTHHVLATFGEQMEMAVGESCPRCQARAVFRASGCATCRDCGWSNCG